VTTRVLGITNYKGGVGKTTAAVNIAHGLALRGKRVLAIDLDPQGTLAVRLGLDEDIAVHSLLTLNVEKPVVAEYVRSLVLPSNRENLWILPGNKRTSEGLIRLLRKPVAYMRWALETVFFTGDYDYIVLDTMPSELEEEEDAPNSALWAADMVLIPVQPNTDSMRGGKKLWDELERISKLEDDTEPTSYRGKSLKDLHLKDPADLLKLKRWRGVALGLMLNQFEEGRSASKEAWELLCQVFSQDLLFGPIHRAAIFEQIAGMGKTIFEREPQGRGAKEYHQVVSKILKARW
jgi:chromosome partitioning protein